MASEVIAGGFGEMRSASTAGGGTALTTTAGFILLPKSVTQVMITPRNFSTAVVAKWCFNPWLVVLKSTDLMVTMPTDYSSAAQDADTSTDVVLSSLDTLANSGLLLIGSHLPFRGCSVDVDAPNAGAASTLSVHYWKSDSTWASITPTDGTASGGKTFAVDGNVTWTVPSDWVTVKLKEVYASVPVNSLTNAELYWTRWTVSAVLDSDTTLNSLVAMNRSTAYSEWLSGQCFEEHINKGINGVGCIEALTDAGTANLIVNVAVSREGGRFT